MNKNALKKILEHPDKDELISKLVCGISAKDIHDWLAGKYTNPAESKFVISEKSVKSFQDNYLDIYNLIQEDIVKTKQAVATSTEDQLELAVKSSPTYKSKMLEIVNNEIDVRKMVAHLCVAVETRLAQVFDEIQEDPRNINTKVDRLLIDYAEVLGNILEKYYKFTENPVDTVIQHNMTIQVVDQHIAVLQEALRQTLALMDQESSMVFMEHFHNNIAKLEAPKKEAPATPEVKLAEAKLLNETINKKLNE